MKISRCFLFLTVSMFLSMVFPGQLMAKTYVCKAEDCDNNQWAPITDTQKNITPSGHYNVTVNQALAMSESALIRNSNGDGSEKDIYLKYNLWHPGGRKPPGTTTDQHLTAYVYSAKDNTDHIKTCHIFPDIRSGYYITTC